MYARSDDGYIRTDWRDWPDVRDRASGDSVWAASTFNNYGMATMRGGAALYKIYRSFFSFDLSALPNKTIRSAVLRLCCTVDTANNISIQQGTQNIPITLTDYQAFTGSYFAAQTYLYGLNDLTFNAAGLIYLKSCLGSVAKLCGREYDHDYRNSQPGANAYFTNAIAYSEWGVSAQRPQLIIGM